MDQHLSIKLMQQQQINPPGQQQIVNGSLHGEKAGVVKQRSI
jgi:hypothetical protein